MQKFPIANLQKHARAQALKARAAAGELELPRVDPKDAAAIAALPPAQLEMLRAGLYRDPMAPDGDGPRVVLPSHWTPDRLAQVQRDYPDDWRSAVRQLGGQA